MKTLSRLMHLEMLSAVTMVTLGFLALFVFFDFVAEVQSVGRHAGQGYGLSQALMYVSLLIPTHVYELLPIAVLIGTIWVMARMAQSSEFTILRTSGLGPWRALRMLLWMGALFTALTFVLGDYLSPLADRSAQLLKARYTGRITVGQTGAWLKEKQGDRQFSVNVGALKSDTELKDIRSFELDEQGFLRSTIRAQSARVQTDGSWTLEQVTQLVFPEPQDDQAQVQRKQLPQMNWPNQISADMVSAALLKPERMSTVDLFQYIRHLKANAQSAQQYEIEFWKKVFYPLSCLVMVVLALPFAYLHFRSGSITTAVFGGVMAGISFFLLNNVFGYMGNLQNWQPWITAALPGLIYSGLSLSAFGWLVLRH
jgi:lipopolysaccharide export system permease protein